MYTYTYIYMYTYIHTYMYTYTYTYTEGMEAFSDGVVIKEALVLLYM
jgi:hypothetical protein